MLLSDTALPLAQLGEQLGLDLYRLSGLDQEGNIQPHCDCYTAAQRAELVFALQFAEALFLRETRTYAAPVAVVNRELAYKGTLIKPPHDQVQQFGVWAWDDLGEVELVRGDINPPNAEFTAQVSVPESTTADEIHVYVTVGDGGTPMERQWEIRPLAVQISGGNANISGPAYLFGNSGCLDANDLSSYIETIHVYRRSVDVCAQGTLEFLPECTPTSTPVRLNPSPPNWWQMQFAVCSDEMLVASNPDLSCWPPQRVLLNYIAGFPLHNGMVDDLYARLLMILAVANVDDDFSFCSCDDAAIAAWERYRAVPKEAIASGISGPNSQQYSLLFDRDMLKRMDGLDPNRGNLTGIQQLRKLSVNVSGGLA